MRLSQARVSSPRLRQPACCTANYLLCLDRPAPSTCETRRYMPARPCLTIAERRCFMSLRPIRPFSLQLIAWSSANSELQSLIREAKVISVEAPGVEPLNFILAYLILSSEQRSECSNIRNLWGSTAGLSMKREGFRPAKGGLSIRRGLGEDCSNPR